MVTVFASFIFALFLIVGCGKISNNDAIEAAKDMYFNKKYIECDGYTYKRHMSVFGKYKNKPVLTVQCFDLTEANKMNGIQKYCEVKYTVEPPGQEGYYNDQLKFSGFTEWRQDFAVRDSIFVTKDKNGWVNEMQEYREAKHLTCDDVLNLKVDPEYIKYVNMR